MSKIFYRTLLRNAGLPENEVKRILGESDQYDQPNHDQEAADHQVEWESDVIKLIALIGRQTGLEGDSSYSINIDGSSATMQLSHGGSYSLAQFLDFANKIATEGLGSNVTISADSDQHIVVTFDLITQG